VSKSIGPQLRKYWHLLSGWPGGKWLFSQAIGFIAPYSGSISASVIELRPGFGVVQLREHRRVRNHLRSVHAIALVNLAEITTGLTLMNSLPDSTRGILTAIQMNYLKKARGLLTAKCSCEIPPDNSTREITLQGEIKNTEGEVVATASAQWLVGAESEK